LQRSGVECRVYGMRRDLHEELVEGNLRYRPFSEQGFIDDSRGCGLITFAGVRRSGA